MISKEKLTELIVEVHNKNCGIDHSHKNSVYLLHQCATYRCAADGILAGLNVTRTVYAAIEVTLGHPEDEDKEQVICLFSRRESAEEFTKQAVTALRALKIKKFEAEGYPSYYVQELELQGSY